MDKELSGAVDEVVSVPFLCPQFCVRPRAFAVVRDAVFQSRAQSNAYSLRVAFIVIHNLSFDLFLILYTFSLYPPPHVCK